MNRPVRFVLSAATATMLCTMAAACGEDEAATPVASSSTRPTAVAAPGTGSSAPR
jgi:hypothetical protein